MNWAFLKNGSDLLHAATEEVKELKQDVKDLKSQLAELREKVARFDGKLDSVVTAAASEARSAVNLELATRMKQLDLQTFMRDAKPSGPDKPALPQS